MIKLIKFSSKNCMPCKMVGMTIAQLKQRNPTIVVDEVDVETLSDEDLEKYSITSVPTIIILKDGVQVDKIVGITSVGALETIIKNNE